jgi:hypothetical protein
VSDPIDPVDRADPIRARRARAARFAALGKRAGWACLLVAVAAFALGAVTDFPAWTVQLAVGGLVGACVILPVPIVVGYGVRAAERDDP